MRKRFTKIICTAVAVLSAAALVVAPGCSSNWKGVSGDKDSATEAVEGTNGGFSVETENYVYFINGKADSTDSNTFGSVVKGSVQRISKSDLSTYNYSNTETVVPSVIYSGSYEEGGGLYIYDGYLYYTTPTTEKNTSGEVLNSNLDFKRTKLDGTDTTSGYIWQSSDNSVEYRYVEVDGTVYILYALSEDLYSTGTSVTNIHSVNCSTGTNTVLAYNVSAYAFDSEDQENAYVYYTMDVPEAMGSSSTFGYNQLYRVRADVTEGKREYDYSEVEDYDAETDPVYINLGDFVFDGIGVMRTNLTQFNYGYAEGNTTVSGVTNSDYTYDIEWYKSGCLYYTRKEGDENTHLYRLTDEDYNAASEWNAISKNSEQPVFISTDYSTEYTYLTMGGQDYALETSSDGIFKMTVDKVDGEWKFGDKVKMSADTSATVLNIQEANDHTYLYYSISGGNGYTVYRIAIDGSEEKYNSLLVEEEADYTSVQILDLDACSDWYKPEFIGNVIIFAAEVEGMTDYNYVMACNLTGANGIMTNAEIEAYNEQYEAITTKIEAYDDETNADGTAMYENLSGALKYQFYTRDSEYLHELIQAYVDISGKDEEYLYSEESVGISDDFAKAAGDWEKDDDGNAYASRMVSGETVYSNTRDYYYALLGVMTDDDAESYIQAFKDDTSYMQAYPEEEATWWDNLSTAKKVWIIVGIVAGSLVVVAGITVGTIFLVKYLKKGKEEEESEESMDVDITDDKDIDVYGDEEEKKE